MADFVADVVAEQDAISALSERAATFLAGEGVDARATHHVALLLDEGSWFETGLLAQPERRTGKKVPGDGVVTGFGRMDGRTVGLIGIDATALAGTTAPVSMRKQGRVIEQAQRLGVQGPRAGRQAGRGGGPRVPGTAVGQPRKDTFADLAAEASRRNFRSFFWSSLS